MADTVKFDALLDDLLKDCQSPEDILGQHGLLKQLTKRLVERALEGELTAHLSTLTKVVMDEGILVV